ncbi:acetyltransferase [Maribacter algicola]|uniref:Acetyltransferase n=1 Tax=Meishania litoralis TaxID=3434685 RepID=A0ACC7LII1_9FLAO
MKNIVIFGASSHGSVVLDCLEKEGRYRVVGFVDSFKRKGSFQNGYEILGTEYDLPYLCDVHNLYGGIIAIGDNFLRKHIADKVKKVAPDFNFISTVHPTALLGKDIRLGKGVAVLSGAIVNTNSKVGDFCILNTNSVLEHDGVMQAYSSLAPGVYTGGNFRLGNFSAIGLRANIIDNITVGEHTVIGAGSLVVKNIGPFVVAYGAPARVVRQRSKGEKYLSGEKNKYVRSALN